MIDWYFYGTKWTSTNDTQNFKCYAYGKQGLGLKQLTLQWLSRKKVTDVWVIGYDKNYFKTTVKRRRVQMFQRPKSSLKILGTGRVT
jgi:hypothetical protein